MLNAPRDQAIYSKKHNLCAKTIVMRVLFSIVIIAFLGALSCKKEKGSQTEGPIEDTCTYLASGRWMSNPYLVEEESSEFGRKTASATHQYIRVWIEDSESFSKWDAIGDFLPFDWRKEPLENGEHSIERSQQTIGRWIYGLVEINKVLPSRNYELIDQRILSEPGSSTWKSQQSKISSQTSIVPPSTIAGSLKFFDPISEKYEPLVGVRVQIRDGGRLINAVTQADGSFTSPNKILSKAAEVLLRFDNTFMEIRTLNLDDLGGMTTPNIISMGMVTACSFGNLQLQIGTSTTNSKLQASGAGWYAYQKFREFATAKGYGIPSKKLNFWAAKDAPINDSYSAPMLRHVGAQQGARDLLVQLFGLPPAIANPLSTLIKNDLPDIYAPYYSSNTNRTPAGHIETLFHEFGHCTHYTQAGNAFWTKYIDHIFAQGGYGDGNDPLSGLVAMSESWAEDFSLEVLEYFYGKEKYSAQLRDENTWRGYPWIPVGVYYDMSDDATNENFDRVSGFSFKEMYDLFSNEVDHPRAFERAILQTYPTKAAGQEADIDLLLRHYGW